MPALIASGSDPTSFEDLLLFFGFERNEALGVELDPEWLALWQMNTELVADFWPWVGELSLGSVALPRGLLVIQLLEVGKLCLLVKAKESSPKPMVARFFLDLLARILSLKG